MGRTIRLLGNAPNVPHSSQWRAARLPIWLGVRARWRRTFSELGVRTLLLASKGTESFALI